jgi:hypothetical protein
LCVSLFQLDFFHVLFGLVFELLDHFILCGSPFVAVIRSFIAIVVLITSVVLFVLVVIVFVVPSIIVKALFLVLLISQLLVFAKIVNYSATVFKGLLLDILFIQF